jgi:1-acyl-sn-glycerol-3-phosphate acyltransferase
MNYLNLKYNFIKIYFIANFTPLKLLFDFSIKSEIEFLQKHHYNIYKSFGTTSLYRMTPNIVSNKKNIIYLANHRTYSDFTIDSIVVYNTATFIGRYLIAIAIPGGNILKLMSNHLEYFVRRQGKTDITAFEKMLNHIQESNRNILIYPEGTRRHGHDYACDLKKGSIYYSYKTNSPIQFVITHGKDDIFNEKKMIAVKNLNAFVYYSKVYDQDYEKYESMEAWYQYINSEWKTFFNMIYTTEHKIEDAFGKIDPSIVIDDNNKRPIHKKYLYIARLSVVSISLYCISKLLTYTTLF